MVVRRWKKKSSMLFITQLSVRERERKRERERAHVERVLKVQFPFKEESCSRQVSHTQARSLSSAGCRRPPFLPEISRNPDSSPSAELAPPLRRRLRSDSEEHLGEPLNHHEILPSDDPYVEGLCSVVETQGSPGLHRYRRTPLHTPQETHTHACSARCS